MGAGVGCKTVYAVCSSSGSFSQIVTNKGLISQPQSITQKGVHPGRNYIHPPPHPPHFGLKGIFEGRGVGVHILRPHAAGIPPPHFFHPPTPRRVFSGVGGLGVYKIWPRSSHTFADSPGARTLIFAAFEPFHSCEFRAAIARTP